MAVLLDYTIKNGDLNLFGNQTILESGNLSFPSNLTSRFPLIDTSPISSASIFGSSIFRSSSSISVSGNLLSIEIPQATSISTLPTNFRFAIHPDASINLNGREFFLDGIFTNNIPSIYLNAINLIRDIGNIGGIISRIVNTQTINGDSGNNNIAIIGSDNVINAGLGNDRIAIAGNSNTLNGEGDNDILAAVGNNNVLNGGTGDDILKASGINNILSGGTGRDVFGVPDYSYGSLNRNLQGQSLIQDFEIGIDKLGLPTITAFNGTSSTFRVLNFNELTITQQGQDTAISYQGNVLAVVKNIQVNQISATDFVNLSELNLPIL